MLVSINGEIFSKDNAKISVFDRSFLFGDSIYEVTKSVNHKLQYLDEHLSRLENSASLLSINLRGKSDLIKNQLIQLHQRLNIPSCYYRIIVSRGISYKCNIGQTDSDINIVIIAQELSIYPQTWYTDGVSLMIAKTKRNHHKCLDPNAKSGNYLNNIIAYQEAKSIGFYDAIMLNLDNKISECTTANIWVVKNGELYTPEDQSGLLKGITRKILFKLAQANSIKTHLVPMTTRDLENADEIFTSSATKEIIPVTTLRTMNDRILQVGPITKKIMKIYKEDSLKSSI